MGELLEILHNMLTDGITWATVISIILAWHKWKEGKQKKIAYERMEAKIDEIMQKEGIAWNGQQSVSQKDQMSLNELYLLCSVGISRAAYLYRWRGRKMQISKAWLVGLLGYVGYFVKQFTGYDVPDELINNLSDMVLLGIALVPMFMNMRKQKTAPQTANEPAARPQDIDPDKFIQG